MRRARDGSDGIGCLLLILLLGLLWCIAQIGHLLARLPPK